MTKIMVDKYSYVRLTIRYLIEPKHIQNRQICVAVEVMKTVDHQISLSFTYVICDRAIYDTWHTAIKI